MHTRQALQAVGVFDSGIGGLSVLQGLQHALPHEHFVYLADNGHAPYGEKSDVFVRARSLAIAKHLLAEHQIKALVVACNTATAAAIHELRSRYPQLPLVGVEPALKPAVALSQTRRIGVMATRGTVGSEKFSRLMAGWSDQAEFVVQACNGLALAIEHSVQSAHAREAQAEIDQLLTRYTQAMGEFGHGPGQIDTLVLGCTHYVFVQEALRQRLGPEVRLVSTGEPVAQQTRRLLQAAGLMRQEGAPHALSARVQLLATGDTSGLSAAAQRWLGLPAGCARSAGPAAARLG
jgi:glutamate racemase